MGRSVKPQFPPFLSIACAISMCSENLGSHIQKQLLKEQFLLVKSNTQRNAKSSLTRSTLKWAHNSNIIWFCSQLQVSQLKLSLIFYHVNTQESIIWASIHVGLHLCGLQSETALGGSDELTSSYKGMPELHSIWTPLQTTGQQVPASFALLLLHTRPSVLELG